MLRRGATLKELELRNIDVGVGAFFSNMVTSHIETTRQAAEALRPWLASSPQNRLGTVCDALFYILDGKVKLAVFSTHGREATIAILNEGDFFGEARLLGQALRMGAATLLARPSATHVVQMEILADVGPFSRIVWVRVQPGSGDRPKVFVFSLD